MTLTNNQNQPQRQQQQQKPPPPPPQQTDPTRQHYDNQIAKLRTSFHASPNDEYKALALADALRARDLAIHDGGSAQNECIEIYHKALQLIHVKKENMKQLGKSVDGLLCAVYAGLGKIYFMANMFEKSVESYDEALNIEPMYLDALSYRASSLIILGRYEEAAMNYTTVIQTDGKQR
eukprot:4271649-Ditylum_brightwellii.AAC.1